MTRVAAIDCGTNTIRLLIADLDASSEQLALREILRTSEIVRLGQGVDRTGMLDPVALQRTLDVTRAFADHCHEHGAQSIRFIATSATRDASNRDAFVDGVRTILGTEPEVVTGEEEAELSFLGSLLGAAPEPSRESLPRLVVDLGGGSTELVLGRRAPEAAISLNTGSVRITERYLADGVTPDAEAAARADVRALLDGAEESVDLGAAGTLIGLAGTITTVTAHALGLSAFEPEALSGARLPVERVLASCEAIIHSTPRERAAMGFLAPGRRDVIAAGALVWSEVVQRVVARTAASEHPVTETVTSLRDILDGIALSQA